MSISAVIIAKNEQERIADCIDSVLFCDEVVVVDAESDDNTKEIAERMGAKVYHCSDEDFAKLRNFGRDKAKGQWILYIDADERVTKDLEKSIKHCTFDSPSNVAAYKIKRKNFYLGEHEWPYIEKLERFFKKSGLKGWYGTLHESPSVDGEIQDLEGFLFHFTHRDLSSMLKKTIKWSKIEAELRFQAGHPPMYWWRFPRVMLSAFFNSYIVQKGWQVGTVGLIESMYQSFSIFITYARLWELQNRKK